MAEDLCTGVRVAVAPQLREGMADLLSAVIHHKNKRPIRGNKRCPRSGPGLFF